MRVRPADFARMCKVSRQAVSKWISKGTIRLAPDGLLDPVAAARELIENSDPRRLRARVFKTATASLGELRARVRSLEAEVGERDAVIAAMQRHMLHTDKIAMLLLDYSDAIVKDFAHLAEAHAQGVAADWLDDLESRVFWGNDPLAGDENGDRGSDSRGTSPPAVTLSAPNCAAERHDESADESPTPTQPRGASDE